jgi:hypothetical protein
LARWNGLVAAGWFGTAVKNTWLFLAVEQTITYKKPISPFQRYVVSTEINVTEDKWIHYTHRFLSHVQDSSLPAKYSGSKPEKEPVEYAVINLRAVCKWPNGKTLKPSECFPEEFQKSVITWHEKDSITDA